MTNTSGPEALLGALILITSIISSRLISTFWNFFSVFIVNSGNLTFWPIELLFQSYMILIKVNTCLKSVNLSWNGLGYEGTLALCEALKWNKTIQHIDISNNRINWKGAEILGRALKKNISLQGLKVWSYKVENRVQRETVFLSYCWLFHFDSY